MPASVLLVEDDEPIRTPLKELLESEGYPVITAGDGLEALDILRRTTPAPGVILLDLMMPRMDGSAFLERRRAEPDLRGIPVVILSAWLHRGALIAGADYVMSKPIDAQRLMEIVKRYCGPGTGVPRSDFPRFIVGE